MNRLPLSHGAATELVPLFRDMLRLCKVAPLETVLLYGDTHTPSHYPAAFLGAAQDLGAIPAMMMVPITSPAVQPWAPHDSAAVIDTGDIILNLGRYVDRPITCVISGGRITDIKGDGIDAFLLREWLAQWKDPNAYVVSHVGWGCHDRANWLRMTAHRGERGGLMDAESFCGDIQIAFGNNVSFSLQGRNDTRAHIDVECRRSSFWVDGELVVDHGTLVHPGRR